MKPLLFIFAWLPALWASALSISAPGVRSWQGYELYMSRGSLSNWIDLWPMTGTNPMVTATTPEPTFYRAQWHSNMIVPLSWDAVIDPRVAGYKIYCGTKSRTYTQVEDAGNATNYIFNVTNVSPIIYFAASCYDASGMEGGYSDECVITNNLTLVIK